MGCDIHVYVEKKNQDGEWETPPALFDEDLFIQGKKGDFDAAWGCDTSYEFYSRRGVKIMRDYSLFSVITNGSVRLNVDIDTPEMNPKGIPNDLSEQVNFIYTRGEYDWHTPSYFTLKELHTIRVATLLLEHPLLTSYLKVLETIITKSFDIPSGADLNDYRIIFWFDN